MTTLAETRVLRPLRSRSLIVVALSLAMLVASPSTAAAADHTGDATETTVLVESGDTLWSIAASVLGDGQRWIEIAALNAGRVMTDGSVFPDGDGVTAIRSGWVLQMPPAPPSPAPHTGSGSGSGSDAGSGYDSIVEHTVIAAPDLIGVPEVVAEFPRFHQSLPSGWETGASVSLAGFEAALLQPGNSTDSVGDAVRIVPTPPAAVGSAGAASETRAGPVVEETAVQEDASVGEDALAEGVAVEEQAAVQEVAASSWRGWLLAGGALTVAVGAVLLRRPKRTRRRPVIGDDSTTPTTDLRDSTERQDTDGKVAAPADGSSGSARTVRTIASHESGLWVAPVNEWLSHSAVDDTARLLSCRVGPTGVELDTIGEFNQTVTDDRGRRLIDPALDRDSLVAASVGERRPVFSPLLCPVGTTDGRELHLDLEAFGTIGVHSSDPVLLRSWLTGLAASVLSQPWAADSGVEVVALCRIAPDDIDGLVCPADPSAWVAERTSPERMAAARTSLSTWARRRSGEAAPVTLAVVGDGFPAESDALYRAAQPGSGLALVTASEVPAEAQVWLGETCDVFPFGWKFTPTHAAPLGPQLPWQSQRHAAAALEQPEPQPEPEPESESELEPEPATSVEVAAPEPEPWDLGEIPVIDLTDTDLGDAIIDLRDPRTAAAGASPSVVALIDAICAPRPIELRIAHPDPHVTGTAEPLTSKQLAIVAYLAYHPDGVVTSTVRETHWPGTEPSSRSVQSAMTLLRRRLGTVIIDGDEHSVLQRANEFSPHRYRFTDGTVGFDLARFRDLVAVADVHDGADAVACRLAALELIEGWAGPNTPPKHFGWLYDDPTLRSQFESSVLRAAYRCASACLDADDPDGALDAIAAGLRVVPGEESLLSLRMRAGAALADPSLISAAYRTIDATSFGDIEERTQKLWEMLTGRAVDEGGGSGDGESEELA